MRSRCYRVGEVVCLRAKDAKTSRLTVIKRTLVAECQALAEQLGFRS